MLESYWTALKGLITVSSKGDEIIYLAKLFDAVDDLRF